MATDDPEIAELAGETLELADILNTALDKGVALHGDVTIAVADIDLIKLNLGLLLGAIETVERGGGRGTPKDTGLVERSEAPSKTPGGLSGDVRTRLSLANALGPPKLDAIAAINRGIPRQNVPPKPLDPPPPETSLNAVAQGLPPRINAEAAGVESGLARLVLTLIEVLRKVLEHQAVRRMDGGKLSEGEIDRLGLALSRLNDRMQELKDVFGLTDDDLHIDLGPLGRAR
jgi:hypothetical protein